MSRMEQCTGEAGTCGTEKARKAVRQVQLEPSGRPTPDPFEAPRGRPSHAVGGDFKGGCTYFVGCVLASWKIESNIAQLGCAEASLGGFWKGG